MVERYGGYKVMKHMRLNYAMEEMASDETKVPVDRSCSSAGEGPGVGFVVG